MGRRSSRAPTGRVLAAARTTGSDPTEASADGAGSGEPPSSGRSASAGGATYASGGGGAVRKYTFTADWRVCFNYFLSDTKMFAMTGSHVTTQYDVFKILK